MKRISVLLLILSVMFLSGCRFLRGDVNNYYLKIKYSPSDSGGELKNVSAVIGSDKFWWSDVSAGEEKTITLSTEKNPANNLTLFYTVGGAEKVWTSENLAEDADYRINLEIDAAGTIKERICRLPCEL